MRTRSQVLVPSVVALGLLALATLLVRRGSDANESSDTPAAAANDDGRERAAATAAPTHLHGTYELSYDVAVDVSGGQLLDLHVKAALLAAPQRGDNGVWHVRHQLQDVKVESITQRDPLARDKFIEELGREMRVDVGADGSVLAVAASRDTSEFALRVLKTIAAFVQVVKPQGAASTWTTEEHDPVGTYTARYEPGVGGLLSKTKQAYTRVASSLPTNVPNAPTSELATEIASSDGVFGVAASVLTRCDVAEATRVMDGTGVFQGMTSTSSVRLKRIDSAARFVSGAAAPSDLVATALDAQPAKGNSASLDYVKIAGRDFSDMLTQLRKIPDDEAHRLQRREVFVGLDALLRNDPVAVSQVVGRILGNDPEAAFLLDALAGSGGEAAQAAISELLRTRKLSVDMEQRLIGDLTIMRIPTPELTKTLEALIDDPDLGRFALFATGAHGDYTAESDPGRAKHILEMLETGYASAATDAQRIDYLSAMGNAQSTTSLPTLENVLASRESTLRAAAANALRSIPSPRVDNLLANTLTTDPAGNVRAAAARALRERTPTEQATAALQRSAETEDHGETRLAVLKTMREWFRTMPSLGPSIRALEDRNTGDSQR